MRKVIGWGYAIVLIEVLMRTLAHAADVPVVFLVEERSLRSIAAGDALMFELYADSACTALVHTQVEDIADVTLLARLKNAKLRGAPAAPGVVELRLVMTDVPPTSPLYLKVTGPHVVPFRTSCQAEPAGVVGPAGARGPAGHGHMVLRDANGATIGPFRTTDYANNGGLVYFRTADGTPLQVTLDSPTSFEPTGLEALFESADCTGTSLYPPPELPQLFLYAAGFKAGRIYYAPPNGTSLTPHGWATYWLTPAQCAGQGGTFTAPDVCCQSIASPVASVLGPIQSIDVSGFVSPFHVELAE